jgi:hypothetical protein
LSPGDQPGVDESAAGFFHAPLKQVAVLAFKNRRLMDLQVGIGKLRAYCWKSLQISMGLFAGILHFLFYLMRTHVGVILLTVN